MKTLLKFQICAVTVISSFAYDGTEDEFIGQKVEEEEKIKQKVQEDKERHQQKHKNLTIFKEDIQDLNDKKYHYALTLFCKDNKGPEECKQYKESLQMYFGDKEEEGAVFLRNKSIELYYIDLNEKLNHPFCRFEQITHIPAIKFFVNGRSYFYEEPEEDSILDPRKILKWLQLRIIQPSKDIKAESEVNSLINAKEQFVYYAGKRNKYFEIFKYIASSYNDIQFIHTFSKPLIKDYGDAVVFHKGLTREGFTLRPPWNETSLAKFVNENRNYHNVISNSTLERLYETDKRAIIMYGTDRLSKEFEYFRQASMNFTNEILALNLNVDKDPQNLKLFYSLGLKMSDLPAVRIIDFNIKKSERKFPKKYKQDKGTKHSVEGIQQFYKEWKNDHLQEYFITQSIQQHKAHAEILIANTLTVTDIQARKHPILFYSPYCDRKLVEKIFKVQLIVKKAFKDQRKLIFDFWKLNTFKNEHEKIPDYIIKKPELWIREKKFDGDQLDVQQILNWIAHQQEFRGWELDFIENQPEDHEIVQKLLSHDDTDL